MNLSSVLVRGFLVFSSAMLRIAHQRYFDFYRYYLLCIHVFLYSFNPFQLGTHFSGSPQVTLKHVLKTIDFKTIGPYRGV